MFITSRESAIVFPWPQNLSAPAHAYGTGLLGRRFTQKLHWVNSVNRAYISGIFPQICPASVSFRVSCRFAGNEYDRSCGALQHGGFGNGESTTDCVLQLSRPTITSAAVTEVQWTVLRSLYGGKPRIAEGGGMKPYEGGHWCGVFS